MIHTSRSQNRGREQQCWSADREHHDEGHRSRIGRNYIECAQCVAEKCRKERRPRFHLAEGKPQHGYRRKPGKPPLITKPNGEIETDCSEKCTNNRDHGVSTRRASCVGVPGPSSSRYAPASSSLLPRGSDHLCRGYPTPSIQLCSARETLLHTATPS